MQTEINVESMSKEYKPSEIAREVDPAGWQAFVELGIANDLIRKII